MRVRPALPCAEHDSSISPRHGTRRMRIRASLASRIRFHVPICIRTDLQLVQDSVEYRHLEPSPRVVVHPPLGTKTLRQIKPGRSRPENPQNVVQDLPCRPRFPVDLRTCVRNQRFHRRPPRVRHVELRVVTAMRVRTSRLRFHDDFTIHPPHADFKLSKANSRRAERQSSPSNRNRAPVNMQLLRCLALNFSPLGATSIGPRGEQSIIDTDTGHVRALRHGLPVGDEQMASAEAYNTLSTLRAPVWRRRPFTRRRTVSGQSLQVHRAKRRLSISDPVANV